MDFIKEGKVGVVNKSFKVIKAFVDHQREWGVRDLAKYLEFPASTLHRLLLQLQEEGIIQLNQRTNKYSIGMELIRISAIVSGEIDIKNIARPFMEELVSKYKETFCLVMYDRLKRKVIWLDKINGPEQLQYVINIGELQPVPYGSSGKSIMAFLEDSQIVKICEDEGFSESKIQELRKELDHIRTNQVASTNSERLIGSKGIAAPILNAERQPMGSLVFTVPISRFDPAKEADISKDIMSSTREISSILGFKSI